VSQRSSSASAMEFGKAAKAPPAKSALGKCGTIRSMSVMRARDYRLFGLTFHSEVELPGITPSRNGRADVSIRQVSALADSDEVLTIDGVATYRVPDARTIEVLPAPGANWGDVRLYLPGTARGADLPLHANAIVVDGRAWAFMGESGSGKSTLAASLLRGGHALVADDVCVVRDMENKGPTVFAGVPRLRLWEDAAIHAGHDPDELQLVVPSDPAYRKFDVPLSGVLSSESAPLQVLCLLEWGDRWRVDDVTGAAMVEALFAHSYRGEYVGTLGDPQRHWANCVALATQVRMFRYVRPRDHGRMDRYNRDAVDAIRDRLATPSP